MKKKKKKRFNIKSIQDKNIKTYLTLFLIFAFLMNSFLIIKSKYPPKGDSKDLIFESILYYKNLNNTSRLIQLVQEKNTIEGPFLSFVFVPYYSIFGLKTENELVINSFFLVLFLYGVYKLGEHIYSKKIGLFSTIIGFYMMLSLSHSQQSYREFYLMCFIPTLFWMLLKTDYFQNQKYVILFSILLGITAYVKYSFGIYIIPALLIYAGYSLKKTSNKKQIIRNFMIFIFIFLLLASIWFLPKLTSILDWLKFRFFENPDVSSGLPYGPFSYYNLSFYLTAIVMPIKSNFYSILFILAVILKLFSKKKFSEKLLIWSFFITVLFFTFITIKEKMFLIPSYFIIPLFIADFLKNLRFKKIKMFLIKFIVIYTIIYPFLLLFTQILFLQSIVFNNLPEYAFLTRMQITPDAKKMFLTLEETKKKDSNSVLLVSHTGLNSDLVYYAIIHEKNYSFYNILSYDYTFAVNKYQKSIQKTSDFPSFDYYYFSEKELIKKKYFDYIIIFLPKEDEKSPYEIDTDILFLKSYEILSNEDFKSNYNFVNKFEQIRRFNIYEKK